MRARTSSRSRRSTALPNSMPPGPRPSEPPPASPTGCGCTMRRSSGRCVLARPAPTRSSSRSLSAERRFFSISEHADGGRRGACADLNVLKDARLVETFPVPPSDPPQPLRRLPSACPGENPLRARASRSRCSATTTSPCKSCAASWMPPTHRSAPGAPPFFFQHLGACRRQMTGTRVGLNVLKDASRRGLFDTTLRCGLLALGVRRRHAPKGFKKIGLHAAT